MLGGAKFWTQGSPRRMHVAKSLDTFKRIAFLEKKRTYIAIFPTPAVNKRILVTPGQ